MVTMTAGFTQKAVYAPETRIVFLIIAMTGKKKMSLPSYTKPSYFRAGVQLAQSDIDLPTQ